MLRRTPLKRTEWKPVRKPLKSKSKHRTNQISVTQVARHQMIGGRAICAYCGKQDATDPHHWLLKQGANVANAVQDDPRNLVLLCRQCHTDFGQTRQMTIFCYNLKSQDYDIDGWIAELEAGVIKHTIDKVWK